MTIHTANKGFTIIELIVSFAFVMVLSLSLMSLLISFKSKSQYTSMEGNLESYTVNIYGTVMKDINNNTLINVSPCNSECKNNDKACLKMTFFNGKEKLLKVREAEEDDKKYLFYSYGGVDFIPPDKHFTKINLEENTTCKANSYKLGTKQSGLQTIHIKWPLVHDDIVDREFGVDIATIIYGTAPGEDLALMKDLI